MRAKTYGTLSLALLLAGCSLTFVNVNNGCNTKTAATSQKDTDASVTSTSGALDRLADRMLSKDVECWNDKKDG